MQNITLEYVDQDHAVLTRNNVRAEITSADIFEMFQDDEELRAEFDQLVEWARGGMEGIKLL